MTATVLDTHRVMKGIAMKLISIDNDYRGIVTDILEYRTAPDGRREAVVLIEEPNAWYSGIQPITLTGAALRLLLSVQSITRPAIGTLR